MPALLLVWKRIIIIKLNSDDKIVDFFSEDYGEFYNIMLNQSYSDEDTDCSTDSCYDSDIESISICSDYENYEDIYETENNA